MSTTNRDNFVLLLKYCNEMNRAVTDLQVSDANGLLLAMNNNYLVQHAISLLVVQVGEISHKLTDTFKRSYPTIKWGQLYRSRNIIAHDYGAIPLRVIAELVFTQVAPLRTLLISLQAPPQPQQP